MVELSAHLNWLFDDGVPVDERLRRSAEAGADAYGWNPWGLDLDRDALREHAATGADLGLDMAYMSCTHVPVADPAERASAVEDLEALLDLGGELGCATLNVLAGGHRPPDRDPATVDDHIVDVLSTVAPTAAANGVTVLVEHSNPIDLPDRYLSSVDHALALLERVDHPSVRFLLDVYHQQLAGGNIFGTIEALGPFLHHLHVAGVPDRRWPGEGELHYRNIYRRLREAGFDGYVECEFLAHDDPEGAVRSVREDVEAAWSA